MCNTHRWIGTKLKPKSGHSPQGEPSLRGPSIERSSRRSFLTCCLSSCICKSKPDAGVMVITGTTMNWTHRWNGDSDTQGGAPQTLANCCGQSHLRPGRESNLRESN